MAEAEQHTETPPSEGDIAILRQYARSQEPAAFMEVSCRYAGVVYGTCLRITANVQDAEELTQDCFLELARKAATVHSSVGGWLHRMATHRALNAVRCSGPATFGNSFGWFRACLVPPNRSTETQWTTTWGPKLDGLPH